MAQKKTKQKRLPLKIGFLGGGQLARMMAIEAHQMGLEPHVFCGSKDEPAALVTSFFTQGNLSDFKALEAFLEKADYLTFESEFVPSDILEKLIELKSPKLFPNPEIMKKLQNRLSQKQTLLDHRIPTAAFVSVTEKTDLEQAWKDLKGPFVLKKNFGGYDGYGTFFAQKFSDLKNLEEKLSNSPQGFMAEKLIPFQKEVAAILVRNQQGQCLSLPLVETSQKNGRCDWVRGPLQHSQWPKLQKKLFAMMKSLGYVGCLGVEMFDTGGELLINELAPRVHNSGHYSQNALIENQFLLHLKAGLGFQLSKPKILAPQFVMTNILGESSDPITIPTEYEGSLHLYGKAENRPGRKMGHLNHLGPKGPALLQKALKERKKFQ